MKTLFFELSDSEATNIVGGSIGVGVGVGVAVNLNLGGDCGCPQNACGSGLLGGLLGGLL